MNPMTLLKHFRQWLGESRRNRFLAAGGVLVAGGMLAAVGVVVAVSGDGDRREEVIARTATPSPTAETVTRTVTASPPPEPTETLAFLREGDIWLVNADGSGERQLTESGDVQEFSWISSEELDVAAGEDRSGHLLVDLEGNAEPLAFPSGGSWSRDGALYAVPVDNQVVVFSRDGSEAARLDVEPPVETGEKPRQCGAGGQPDRLVFGRPEFSSDQQRILVAVNCVSRAGATGNLYAPVSSVSLVDGTQQQTELQVNLEDGPSANFAPDGSRVAQSIRFGGSACSSGYSLFVADADGTNAREIALPAVAVPPEESGGEVRGGVIGYDWSSSSQAVIASVDVSICPRFDIDLSGELQPVDQGLYILPLDGSSEDKLVDGPTHSPAWSPSGRYVAYVPQDYFGEVTEPPLLRIIGVTARDVVDLGHGAQPAWQPQR